MTQNKELLKKTLSIIRKDSIPYKQEVIEQLIDNAAQPAKDNDDLKKKTKDILVAQAMLAFNKAYPVRELTMAQAETLYPRYYQEQYDYWVQDEKEMSEEAFDNMVVSEKLILEHIAGGKDD